jgi:hypothetical protein
MSAALAPRTPPADSIARRAIDLSRDGRLSVDEGAHHLCHLARHEQTALAEALRALPPTPDAAPEEECARRLLTHALTTLRSSSGRTAVSSP